MKKTLILLYSYTLILLCFLSFAPAARATDDPFDLILENRNYEPISGYQDYIYDFIHEQDPQATPPQLNTLIENNGQPEITSLYQIHDWDGGYYNLAHVPEGYVYAPVVGFGTTLGQNILVPESGYDIGGGYEVMILYADADSITFDYGNSGSLADAGYTIHLENFQVDPRIVALYNQTMMAGGNELPVLAAGAPLGQASGNEVLVAIRDTGSFMDPRWVLDWWRNFDPATATALELELMNALLAGQPAQKFGLCLADEDLEDEVVTRGESFEIELTSCFGKYDDPNEARKAIEAIIRTKDFDFADNQPMVQPLDDTLDRLTPYKYTNLISDKTTLGKISYEVCEEGTRHWFFTEEGIEFKTAPWVNQLKTEGREVALRIMPLSSHVLGEKTEKPRLLAQAEAGSIPHGCMYYYSINPNDPTDCSCMNQLKADGKPSCRGEHRGPGCCPMHGHWGICGWDDCRPDLCSPSELQTPCWGDVVGPGLPISTPTPPMCHEYIPEGGNLPPQKILCVAGECGLNSSSANPAYQLFQSLIQAGQQITQEIEKQLLGLLGCRQKTFWITPFKREPHTGKIDLFLRDQSFSPFNIAGHEGSEEAFEFEHALEDSVQEWEASPVEETNSILEIYGQKGVKDSYDWVQKSLTPYRGLPR